MSVSAQCEGGRELCCTENLGQETSGCFGCIVWAIKHLQAWDVAHETARPSLLGKSWLGVDFKKAKRKGCGKRSDGYAVKVLGQKRRPWVVLGVTKANAEPNPIASPRHGALGFAGTHAGWVLQCEPTSN